MFLYHIFNGNKIKIKYGNLLNIREFQDEKGLPN